MPIYTHRDNQFYTEVMVVTIVSIAAAQLWSKALDRFLDKLYGDNLFTDILGALVITVIAIFLLQYLFAVDKNTDKGKRKEVEGVGSIPKEYGMFHPLLQGSD